jgi:hypothetical protein
LRIPYLNCLGPGAGLNHWCQFFKFQWPRG